MSRVNLLPPEVRRARADAKRARSISLAGIALAAHGGQIAAVAECAIQRPTRERLHQCALAGPRFADDGKNFTRPEIETHIATGHSIAEAFAHVANRQKGGVVGGQLGDRIHAAFSRPSRRSAQ